MQSHLDDGVAGALAKQAAQLADYQTKLMSKAEKISAKERAKDPEGNGPSAQEIYDKVGSEQGPEPTERGLMLRVMRGLCLPRPPALLTVLFPSPCFLAQAMGSLGLQPNTLALFGRDDLAEVAIPNMSPAALAGAASAAVMMIMGAFADPTKLAMKAAAMAAKVIIKIYFAVSLET